MYASDNFGEPTNQQRAEWAYAAVKAFAAQTNQDKSGDLEHDLPSVIGDLLADMMHLADERDIDFDNCLRNGAEHYAFEKREFAAE